MKDLIILGNGMAGMTAALYAKRANLDFKIVGKDEFDFGQIGNAILVENFPCAAAQSGFELAMSLHDQLEANDIKIEEHTVKQIRKTNDMFIIDYKDNEYIILLKSNNIDVRRIYELFEKSFCACIPFISHSFCAGIFFCRYF